MTWSASLHTKVLVITFFSLIGLFATLWYVSLVVEAETLEERLRLKGRSLSAVIGLLMDQAAMAKDPERFKQELMQAMLSDEDKEIASVRIGLWNRQSFYLPVGIEAISPHRYLERPFPLQDRFGRHLGWLQVGFWQRAYLAGTSWIFVLNTVIAVDMLVLAGLMLHFMLRQMVTRPLAEFVEATKRVAEGEFHEPVVIQRGTSEEERLAMSFNEMLGRLNESREDLRRINADLEDRVAQRTYELGRAKLFAETVIANAAEGLYVVDESRTLTFFNRAAEELTGASAADVLGRPCYEVLAYPFCRTDCILERLHRGRSGQRPPVEAEEYIEETRSDGKSWVVSGAIFDDPSGQFAGGVESIKDLSHTRRLQRQIRQLDKMSSLGTLSAGIAHELNNPLSNINLNAQLLSEEMGRSSQLLDESSRQSIRNIVDQTNRAGSIVRKLLEFARETNPQFEPVDLGQTVVHGLDMVRYMLEMNKIRIDLDIRPDLPPVAASRVGLQQVIINLLNNARQAMKNGGVLGIRVWEEFERPCVHFSVSDTGEGIAKEHLGRIFDPFFTTKAVGDGTGLGLSISYGIIKDHKGEISVESTPGQGTTFTISLPCHARAEAIN